MSIESKPGISGHARNIAGVLMLIMTLIAAGCAPVTPGGMKPSPPVAPAPATGTAQASIIFVRQQPMPDPKTYPAALLPGRLVQEGLCLRVVADTGGTAFVPVWPSDYALGRDAQGNLVVRDGQGAIVYRVGEHGRFGGGEILADEQFWLSSPVLRQPPPKECPGPYWVVAPRPLSPAPTLAPPATATDVTSGATALPADAFAPGAAMMTYYDPVIWYAIDYPYNWYGNHTAGGPITEQSFKAVEFGTGNLPAGASKIELMPEPRGGFNTLEQLVAHLKKGGEGGVPTVSREETWQLAGGVPAVRMDLQLPSRTEAALVAVIHGRGLTLIGYGDLTPFDAIAHSLRPVSQPAAVETPVPVVVDGRQIWRYTDPTYGVRLDYPPAWTLLARSDPHRIALRQGEFVLNIGVKRVGESEAIVRTGVGAGDLVTRGQVSILGQQVSRDVLVYQAKDKGVLYNQAKEFAVGNLVFTISLDSYPDPAQPAIYHYDTVELAPDVQAEADRIVASFALVAVEPSPPAAPAPATRTPAVQPTATSALSARTAQTGRIVFEARTGSGSDIFSMNPDGSDVRQLTHGPELNLEPACSPDGTRIAFTAWQRSGTRQLYLIDADGSGERQLADGPGNLAEPAWSPDGQQIAFNSEADKAFYVINADGSGRARLPIAGDNLYSPVWSPDGQRLAYTSYTGKSSDLRVARLDGSGDLNLTGGTGFSFLPAWSPDGRQIAFYGIRGEGNTYEIYVIDADGSNLRQLTSSSDSPYERNNWRPAWSPDGKQIAFYSDFDHNSIWVMNADGTGQVRITDPLLDASNPCWLPTR